LPSKAVKLNAGAAAFFSAEEFTGVIFDGGTVGFLV
jgi:hypothetical protein